MGIEVRRIDYFYCRARDRPGEAARLLSELAAKGVNLLAFNAIPAGSAQTQLMLFPEDPDKLLRVAEAEGLDLVGPRAALLVRGQDQIGAFAEVHRQVADLGINISASVGVADGRGGYAGIIYLPASDADRAVATFEAGATP